MAISRTDTVIQYLRRIALVRDGGGLTDAQLLESFISRRDATAMEALVRRHGPMVWGVCHRTLANHHDAEDAFQATFLVLVRKADSVVPREMVANWLYGVAHQTALKARQTAAKRSTRERQVMEMPESELVQPDDLWDDLRPVLDQELSQLPDTYRAVLILCDLEGKTRKEAAEQLGVPEGTVASRLARARVMLSKRLARRGLSASGGALAVALSVNVASAGVPTAVLSSTIKTTTLVTTGQAAAGVISAKVAALTEGVLKAMLVTKLKTATVVLLVLGLVGSGAGIVTHRALAESPPKVTAAQPKPEKVVPPDADPEKAQKPKPDEQKPEVEKPAAPQRKKPGTVGKLDAVDAGKNTITITVTGKDGLAQQKTFEVGPEAEILLDGKKAKLGDLKTGSEVRLALADGAKGETPKVLSVEMGEAERDGGDPKKGDGQPTKKKGESSPDK